VVSAVAAVVADPIASEVAAVSARVPDIVRDADDALVSLQGWLDRNGIDLQLQEPGRTALQTLGDELTAGSGALVDLTRDALTLLVEASLAVILVIVLAIYMLLYGERIGAAVRSVVPRGDGSPEDDFP